MALQLTENTRLAFDPWSLEADEVEKLHESVLECVACDEEFVELDDRFAAELTQSKLTELQITHLISRRYVTDTTEPASTTPIAAANPVIHILKPEWLLVSMQRGQLEPEEFYSTHPSKIFSGMNVCLGDLIDEDRHLLVAFVEEFGGQWSEELRPTTTHLVMMRGQGPLYEQALLTSTTGQSDIRIVLPHFFEDCVKLRRLVPDEEYRFPEPALLRTDVDRTTAALQRSAALRGEQPVASAVLTPKPADKPFLDPKRHVFYIDPHSRIQAAVVTEYSRLLKLAGGTVVNSYDCDCVSHVICNLQGTFCYKQALADGKVVGTIYWLLEVLRSHNLSSPLGRLLFYPWPAIPVPKMSRLRISVTNYTSLSREIIKTMITNMGAQYTSQLTPDNTHLICAAAEGEKYRKAQEWNVNIVNHLWIEDCWQKWTLQALTKPQYLVHRMSLSRVVGDIPVPDGFLNKLASVEMAAEMRTPQQPTSRKRMRAQTSDLPPKMISTSHVADCSILMDEDNHQVPIIFANHPPLGESVEGDTVALVTSVKEEEPTAETEQQTSSPPSLQKPRYMLTGIVLEPRKQRELRHLGAKEVSNIKDCTYLITAKIVRTEKMLSAIALCTHIISEQWIDESIKAGKLLDPRDFSLIDKESEREYGFTLNRSLARAAQKKLFTGYTVFVGASAKPGIEVLKNLVEIHGGHCFPVQNLTRRYKSLDKNSIIIVADRADINGVKIASDLQLPLYNTEFILLGILTQELRFDDENFLSA